jgi:hypothetical protein
MFQGNVGKWEKHVTILLTIIGSMVFMCNRDRKTYFVAQGFQKRVQGNVGFRKHEKDSCDHDTD